MNKKKVLIGMSGGVDSSVAAAILKEQGYEVIGVTMQIWPDKGEYELETEGGCCSLTAVDDARRVAYKLGIPYYVLNFKDIFEKKVIGNFIDEYSKGRTPNPCIVCNKEIKFDELLNKALSLDAYYVATGHYAKIEYDNDQERYLLKKSGGGKKDQTYFLYGFTQFQLEHTLMPLSDITKDEVRKIAEQLELPVAHKSESQDICFVEDNNHGEFIKSRIDKKIIKGNFLDKDGKVLGKHKGLPFYTIGQRRGLGLSLKARGYVTDINALDNSVTIGSNEDLFRDSLIANDLNFISIDKLTSPMQVQARIRYGAKDAEATIIPIDDEKIKVEFKEPQRAITPGQAVVFYQGDILVGGGTIIS